jgi:putative oxidoreductase
VKQALGICRRVEPGFATLRPAMRLAVGPYWGFRFVQTGWAKRPNPSRIIGFSTRLEAAFSVFDAHFASRLELTLGVLVMLGLLSRRGELSFACNVFVQSWTADRAALTPVFPDPGRFSVTDPYSFLFAALMVFILAAGLFSLDTHSTKKVRTARS